MKKVLVVFAVLALTMAMASMAQAEITMDGSIEFLMRSLNNTSDWSDDTSTAGDYKQTYERVRVGVNAKHEEVSGRVQIENDWDVWGRVEAPQANGQTATNAGGGQMEIREAWVNFNLPFGMPGHIKVGHQFLKLGNGWFFRSGKYGSDAWVIGFPGKNTVAFVNVKADEGVSFAADDTDAYVLLDTYKIDDNSAAGIYWTRVKARGATTAETMELDNIGLHYNGVVGPVKLAAELDFQMGDMKDLNTGAKADFAGNQIVVQAALPMDALTVRGTLARGSGQDLNSTSTDVDQYVSLLDKDGHYTLIYEYFMVTAAYDAVTDAYDLKNTGFTNTQAFNLGADFKVNDMITLAADLWMLQAVEKVSVRGAAPDTDLGTELDVKVNLKLYDQLTWNTTVGMFMPGKAYENAAGDADNVQAIQSVLSYKF